LVNGRPLTVVGVAPAGFTGTTLGNRPEVFVPIAMRPVLDASATPLDDRRAYWAYLFGRLRPGTTLDDARRQLDAAYRPIITEVEAAQQPGATARYLAEFRARRIAVTPGARGQSRVHAVARTPLVLLLGTSAVVLLIACANVANLLLARGAARAGEMAVRLSIGASRRRLVRQLLAEAWVLAAAGGVVGLFVARWTMAGVAAILPPEAAGTFRPALDWPVVAFTAAASLVTALVFGTFPALQSTRPDLIARVRAGAAQVAGGSRAAARFRTGLVGAQVAVSMALLVAAALFLRSITNLSRADLGLAVDRTITFGLSPERNGYSPARSRALFARLSEELAAVPGVVGVAAAQVPILANNVNRNDVRVEGFREAPDADRDANTNGVSAGYFRAIGVPLVAGREFTDADRAGAPAVAIVNQAFVRKFGLTGGAVGRRMAVGPRDPLAIEIVGVARDTKYSDVARTRRRSTSARTRRTPRPTRSRSTCARRSSRRRCSPPRAPRSGASTRTCRSRSCGRCPSRCATTRSSTGWSERWRARSRHSRRCWRRSGSTACSPTRWPSGRASWACARRWARRPATCAGWCSGRSAGSCSRGEPWGSWRRSRRGAPPGRCSTASRGTTRPRWRGRRSCSGWWRSWRATCPPAARRAPTPCGSCATSRTAGRATFAGRRLSHPATASPPSPTPPPCRVPSRPPAGPPAPSPPRF
jgi:hypothetical protein